MLNIFICEDNEKQRKIITDTVSKYIMMENLDMNVTISTGNPHEILDYLENHQVNGLYFLDIDLETDMTRIELGAKIRNFDKRGAIVFITSYAGYMSATFDYAVEAMGFITKGNVEEMKEKIIKSLQVAQNRLMEEKLPKNLFQFKSDGKEISEPFRNILLFEVSQYNPRKLTMYARNRQIDFYGKLSEIEKMNTNLFRSHRSVVVNIDNVIGIDKENNEVLLNNDDSCPISARKIGALRKKMAQKENREKHQ